MSLARVDRTTAPPQRPSREDDTPAKAESVALVPMAPHRLGSMPRSLARPDPCFVTHLIAMAELSPQTRLLRRAAPEDVQAAYRAVADQSPTTPASGGRVEQIA